MGTELPCGVTLSATETLIEDVDIRLHRIVVDPAWVQDGVVSPQAFTPRPQDNGRLSVTDKGLNPEQALEKWRVRFPKTKANAAATVTVGECLGQGLKVIDDSGDKGHHVSADYRAISDVDAVAFVLADACSLWP